MNSVGYSLASYPATETTTATGDATYTTDIPDNAGSTAETNTLYKEGTGYPALTMIPP